MFFANDKKIFLEAQITIIASLVIWLTSTEYFPLHVKGSVGGTPVWTVPSRFLCSRVGRMSSDFCTVL